MNFPENVPRGSYNFSSDKRLVDLVLSAAFLLPAEVVRELVIRKLKPALDRGPSIIRQWRMGGVILDKARTMNMADPSGQIAKIESHGESSNIDDPRIPNEFAQFVRLSRADEAPQVRQVFLGAIFGRGKYGSPRLSMAGGLRPQFPNHALELYRKAKQKEPEAAEWWYEIGVPHGPKALITTASLAFMGRASNAGVDAARWVRLEYESCRYGTARNDFELVGQATRAVGSLLIAKTIEEISERMSDVFPRFEEAGFATT